MGARRRRDGAERRDADAHAFEALEAVDDAAGRRVGCGQGDGRRERPSGSHQDDAAGPQRGHRRAPGLPQQLAGLPLDADLVAGHGFERRRLGAGRNEDAVRRRCVAVADRHLQEEPVDPAPASRAVTTPPRATFAPAQETPCRCPAPARSCGSARTPVASAPAGAPRPRGAGPGPVFPTSAHVRAGVTADCGSVVPRLRVALVMIGLGFGFVSGATQP